MGCPPTAPAAPPLRLQDNLLWERLTAREHLTFFARLKNLKARTPTSCPHAHRVLVLLPGLAHTFAAAQALVNLLEPCWCSAVVQGQQLTAAVEEALQKVNLYNGGVGDKQVRRQSRGRGLLRDASARKHPAVLLLLALAYVSSGVKPAAGARACAGAAVQRRHEAAPLGGHQLCGRTAGGLPG